MSKQAETHARLFQLETEALIEVGFYDENGRPKQGEEGLKLIRLAHQKLRERGINIPDEF